MHQIPAILRHRSTQLGSLATAAVSALKQPASGCQPVVDYIHKNHATLGQVSTICGLAQTWDGGFVSIKLYP